MHQVSRRATSQRSRSTASAPGNAHGATKPGAESWPSHGRPLGPSTRPELESRIGANLGAVRIHDDARTNELASVLGARAFTIGSNIGFAKGAFQPATTAGRSLLAHEVVHAVQSGGPLIKLARTNAGGCAGPGETVDEHAATPQGAGMIAHSQIQGFLSTLLDNEVPIPRATKQGSSMDLRCPGPVTNQGFADLWFATGMDRFEIGEIKSTASVGRAQDEVRHYRRRASEAVDRLSGSGSCGTDRSDAADRAFDHIWLHDAASRSEHSGRLPTFVPLTRGVTTEPMEFGPFWGNPLEKWLKAERRADGAVAYWCVNRDLTDDKREEERQRLRVPVGEPLRVPLGQLVAPRVFDLMYEYREVFVETGLPVGPNREGTRIVLTTPQPIFDALEGQQQMRQFRRMVEVDIRGNPVFQFRHLWITTAGVAALVGTLVAGAIAAAAIAGTAAAPAVIGVGGGGLGTAAEGAVVVELFAGGGAAAAKAAAASGWAKAAAVLLAVGSLGLGASEAEASDLIRRTVVANPATMVPVDLTHSPRRISARVGSSLTVEGRPYRVIGVIDY